MNEPVSGPSNLEPLAALLTPMPRRRALSLLGLGGIGLIAAACGSGGDGGTATTGEAATTTPGTTTGTSGTTGSTTTTTASTATTAASATDATVTTSTTDLTETPEETAGPFPADGSNDNGDGRVADVLADSRIVRADIRSDLDGSNTQAGLPMALTMNVVDGSGQPRAGAAVYIWHCSRDGHYSAYSSGMNGGDHADRSYFRGVQIADGSGNVTFQTVLAGRYQGRAFHIHFDVYADDTYADTLLTSQMGMDDDLIDSIYAAADGYASALQNDTDNDDDGIFGDGADHQSLTVTGDAGSGLTATFIAVV
jgi:protocatechuate 3,4-dioxygenase beta subunit